MGHPLDITFQHLLRSRTAAANELLLAALDARDIEVRDRAALGTLERTGTRWQIEVLRRLPTFSSTLIDQLRVRRGEFETALKQLLESRQEEDWFAGLQAVRLLEDFCRLDALLPQLLRPQVPDRNLLFDLIRRMIDRLYDELQRSSQPLMVHRADLRQTTLLELGRLIKDSTSAEVVNFAIEAILILGDSGNVILRQTLWTTDPVQREVVDRLLLESPHPGVMRGVVNALDQAYPHPPSLEALQRRTDPEFIGQLLRQLGRKLSTFQQRNLKQITRLAWLNDLEMDLSVVPPDLQPALVNVTLATGLTRQTKAGVINWLLRFGAAGGRLAASAKVDLLENGVMQTALVESLESTDADVQAWATSQLRAHSIPTAFALLAERLDSPHAEVRAAAKRELGSFNVELALSMVDKWDRETARRAGELLLKIDDEALSKLRFQLTQVVRQRQMRTAVAVAKLGLQEHFLDDFAAMACDSDPAVRRLAAEIMGTIPDPAVGQTLQRLSQDTNERVRQAATASFVEWEQLSQTFFADEEMLFEA